MRLGPSPMVPVRTCTWAVAVPNAHISSTLAGLPFMGIQFVGVMARYVLVRTNQTANSSCGGNAWVVRGVTLLVGGFGLDLYGLGISTQECTELSVKLRGGTPGVLSGRRLTR